MSLRIRKAAPADHVDLARLRIIMLEQITGEKFPPEYLHEMDLYFQEWDGEESLCLVAEEGGRILGSVAVSFSLIFPGPKNPTGRKAEVHNLAVYEKYRGRGVGRALFAAALEECRARDVGRISLYASDMGAPSTRALASPRRSSRARRCAYTQRDRAARDLDSLLRSMTGHRRALSFMDVSNRITGMSARFSAPCHMASRSGG